MFNNTLKSRVLKVINSRLNEAQKQLDLENKALEDKLKLDKEALLETHVNKILGKIL